jgi:hypothetical protein
MVIAQQPELSQTTAIRSNLTSQRHKMRAHLPYQFFVILPYLAAIVALVIGHRKIDRTA